MSTSSLSKMNINYWITSAKIFPIPMKIFLDIWSKMTFSHFQFLIKWTRANAQKINEYIPISISKAKFLE